MNTELTSEMLSALRAPFPIEVVEIRPGVVRDDGKEALALAYVDWREYADRLDRVIGPTGWSVSLTPWGETRIIATLTICGIAKSATGEGLSGDQNCGTAAEAQAKKRACAEFGIGRYFYRLPSMWAPGRGDRRHFRFNDPRSVVRSLYTEAGLMPEPQGSGRMIQAPQRNETQRCATATLPQCRKIAALMRQMSPDVLKGLGVKVDMCNVKSPEDILALGLSKTEASHIISNLEVNELFV